MAEHGWMTDAKRKKQLEGEAKEPQIKPPEIETENIFDPELLNRSDPAFLEEMDSFLDNPVGAMMKVLINYLDSLKPRILEPIKSEHKVYIFQLNDPTDRADIAAKIEAFLNDGYCCHMPTVVNDFVIMDFSRRKENEEK